jgi:hypothetical protein
MATRKAPVLFRQVDLTRAVRATRAGGLEIVRTEIDRDGRIVLVHAADSTPAATPFDSWRAQRDAG